MLRQLINLFLRDKFGWISDCYPDDESFSPTKDWIEDIINNKAKPFLQWLIDNWHIEEIKSEKKSWPDINDYIKYIAETEDPIKTLVSMLK